MQDDTIQNNLAEAAPAGVGEPRQLAETEVGAPLPTQLDVAARQKEKQFDPMANDAQLEAGRKLGLDADKIAALIETTLAPGEREKLVADIEALQQTDKAELVTLERRKAQVEARLGSYAHVLAELQKSDVATTTRLLMEAVVRRAAAAAETSKLQNQELAVGAAEQSNPLPAAANPDLAPTA